ncbi:hypothetical protein AEST_06460 [Alishewanella aestuarii B11]|uniref:Uncharacterized protein n=1 Tax=Alishewanella aestuarii B11 TaxID=1197174 RepID=J1YEI2_9ALTE|nr:hypothetical protein AEST_06460 [Alishewanella aestuarii B11]
MHQIGAFERQFSPTEVGLHWLCTNLVKLRWPDANKRL